jgi:hypothetical protein
LLILITDNILKVHPQVTENFFSLFLNYSNTSIASVELLVYYYYFFRTLTGKITRKVIILMAIFYSLLILIYMLTSFDFLTNRFTYISYVLSAAEFIFLLPFCLLYFHQLLNNTSTIRLFDRPSFWIVTGIFFYSFVSIPFLLLVPYINKNFSGLSSALAAAFYYAPFICNFIFLSKAFLCKKHLTI